MSVESQVRERPILFSGPMVKAILEGRKTQTRRAVAQPNRISDEWKRADTASIRCMGKPWEEERYLYAEFFKFNGDGSSFGNVVGTVTCPYGQPGDHLWVRETWADADCMYQSHNNDVPGTIAYFADKSAIQYDSRIPRQVGPIDLGSWNWNALKRRPSIFMPRWASRITLEITNIRVERLQDISAADAKAEGIEPFLNRDSTAWRAGFQLGWNEINAKRGYSWESNPWVWVIEFRKL